MTGGRGIACAIALATCGLGAASPALGHEVRPGYLEMTEVAPGRYDVLFKTPSAGGLRLKMHAVLPESCPTDDLIDGNPWRLSAVAPRAYRAAPRLGDDTEQVLRELLGLTLNEVEGLRDEGVLA